MHIEKWNHSSLLVLWHCQDEGIECWIVFGIEVNLRIGGLISPAGRVVVLEVCGVSDSDVLHLGHPSCGVATEFGANGGVPLKCKLIELEVLVLDIVQRHAIVTEDCSVRR